MAHSKNMEAEAVQCVVNHEEHEGGILGTVNKRLTIGFMQSQCL